ncbi:ricin-type beta-trefoil lectin protein [Nonomuraea fuscirosea]|uniref:Ricin-type beta-trefoil lectin protein n=1 Tax=Nonomuraea fuscirosea TaxID=1291556 RepID=A0A2T0N2B7_9ACTN|nr:RICIN domain-containing protein [Nonomuraea fuscirosea]PRX66124.1 ricin-type beta-trefoil lectin protein [Nonomuraea fuscirosea]
MSKTKGYLNAIIAPLLVFAAPLPAFAKMDSNRDRGPDTWINNKITGGQLFVDIPSECRYNIENPECVLGRRIRLGARIGGNYHAFFFESSPGITGDLIRWTGLNGTKCLDVAHDGKANGAAVVLWGCHGGPNQRWRADSFYSGPHKGFRILVSVSSGKCLDVHNGAYPEWPRPNAPLQIWDCFHPTDLRKAANRVNQVWEFKRY